MLLYDKIFVVDKMEFENKDNCIIFYNIKITIHKQNNHFFFPFSQIYKEKWFPTDI